MGNELEKYHGIFPAFFTCYDDAGEVSEARTRTLARHLIDKGVKGLYVAGSSGECIYLDKHERAKLLEYVMAEVGGECTIIAHVAANNTRDSMYLASHAQLVGVDAIAAIPPIYFHLPDYAIADYWNAISNAAPDTDFFIYNIPQLAGVALSVDLYRRMLENPRVIGLKNSSLPAQDIQIFKQIGGERCIVFNGPDEQFVAGRAIGADSGIGSTYSIMPELFLEMDALIRAGDINAARDIQFKVNEIIYTMFTCRANLGAVMKHILYINEGLDLGSVRAPLYPLTEADMPKTIKCAELTKAAIESIQKV